MRNENIDIFRGFLLILMIVDHSYHYVAWYTYQFIGFVSAAEFFILISGFLVGLKTSKDTILKNNIWILKRTFKLYYFHIFTLILLVYVLTKYNLGMLMFSWAEIDLWIRSLYLSYTPSYFDILPLYIFLLLITPLILFIKKYLSWNKIIIISFIVWLISQNNISFFQSGSFNILSWQFIWFLGFYLSSNEFKIIIEKIKGIKYINFFILTILILCFYFKQFHNFNLENIYLNKSTIGVVRLTNIISLILIYYIYSEKINYILIKYFQKIKIFGQHSLFVLVLSIFFTYMARYLIENYSTDIIYPYLLILLLFELIFIYVLLKIINKNNILKNYLR